MVAKPGQYSEDRYPFDAVRLQLLEAAGAAKILLPEPKDSGSLEPPHLMVSSSDIHGHADH